MGQSIYLTKLGVPRLTAGSSRCLRTRPIRVAPQALRLDQDGRRHPLKHRALLSANFSIRPLVCSRGPMVCWRRPQSESPRRPSGEPPPKVLEPEAVCPQRQCSWLNGKSADTTQMAQFSIGANREPADSLNLQRELLLRNFVPWACGRKQTVGEALRRAMTKVREHEPHPAFWAPFVVLGDAETRIAKGPASPSPAAR
jgi:hypothetical protein